MTPFTKLLSKWPTHTYTKWKLLLKFILAVSSLFVLCFVRHLHSDVLEESFRYIAQAKMFAKVKPVLHGSLDPGTDWIKLVGAQQDLFIYSAYLDFRTEPPTVHMVALAPRETEVFVECTIWSASNRSTTVRGRVQYHDENHGRAYGSAFVDCPLQTDPAGHPLHSKLSGETLFFEPPTEDSNVTQKARGNDSVAEEDGILNSKLVPVIRVTVSTVPERSKNYSASIPVDNLAERRKIGELNVCVKQMHSKFNSASRLVEFIEFYRLVGADHFTFYNLSIGPDVDRVLQHYVEEGLADVMPFSAPVLQKGLSYHDNGTIASLNDCILRSAGLYSLVAAIDVDEYIVPRQGGDLPQMVQELGYYTEYSVKNLFFYLFYDDDKKEESSRDEDVDDGPYLVTQRKTRRVKEAGKDRTLRSKYLCRPEKVYAAGNHYMHQTFEERSVLELPDEVALNHHYRHCEIDMDSCIKRPTMVDNYMHRYKTSLTSAVVTSCRAIFPERPGCPSHPE